MRASRYILTKIVDIDQNHKNATRLYWTGRHLQGTGAWGSYEERYVFHTYDEAAIRSQQVGGTPIKA